MKQKGFTNQIIFFVDIWIMFFSSGLVKNSNKVRLCVCYRILYRQGFGETKTFISRKPHLEGLGQWIYTRQENDERAGRGSPNFDRSTEIIKASKGFQGSMEDQKFVSTGRIICMTSDTSLYLQFLNMANSSLAWGQILIMNSHSYPYSRILHMTKSS